MRPDAHIAWAATPGGPAAPALRQGPHRLVRHTLRPCMASHCNVRHCV
ncbi:hypothetical protein [Nonomuraea solani]